jgi:predicted transcriptional regulator YheO
MNICVKYAQCVKYMTFIGYLCKNMDIDVLVLFLKSCVQFLVDTTESGNSSVFMKKNGDTPTQYASRILV